MALGILQIIGGGAALALGLASSFKYLPSQLIWFFFLIGGLGAVQILASLNLNSKPGKALGIALLVVAAFQFPIGTLLAYLGLREILNQDSIHHPNDEKTKLG